jgi:hypothetical protein
MSKTKMKHPSKLKNFKKEGSFHQNGIHIYEISKKQAKQIMREFPEFFSRSSFKGVKRLFYLDARRSKQPIILGLE